MHETNSPQLRDRRAGLMRSTTLFLGGIAGFLAVGYAAFSGLVDSIGGSVTSGDVLTFFLGALGLVGAVFARRRPGFCAGCVIVGGVGLLAQRHSVLGVPMLAAAVLAGISIRVSPPAARAESVRGDAASAVTALAVAGLGLVAGAALLVLAALVAVLALSGGSASGGVSALFLIPVGCLVAAVALLTRRARR
jgi:hypothetical protein